MDEMNYVVVELQTTAGTTNVLTNSYSDRNTVEQKYHQILSYAAVSTVEFHTASMLDQFGNVIKSECYTHLTQEET